MKPMKQHNRKTEIECGEEGERRRTAAISVCLLLVAVTEPPVPHPPNSNLLLSDNITVTILVVINLKIDISYFEVNSDVTLTHLSVMSNAATPSQAKALYQEPKVKLCEKICLNVNTFGSVAESIIHGKDQYQPLTNAINTFVASEKYIDETNENLKKLAQINLHLSYQYDAVNKFAQQLDQLKEVSQSMRR